MKQKEGTDRGRHDNSYYDRERRLRRWFGEVIIIFYQMPVLVEARGFGSASTFVRGQFADAYPAASENFSWMHVKVCEEMVSGSRWGAFNPGKGVHVLEESGVWHTLDEVCRFLCERIAE